MSTHDIHLKYRTPKRYPTIISIVFPGVALIVTFRGSNYRCLEQLFLVSKGFEPSKFDCIYIPKVKIVLTSQNAGSIICMFFFCFFFFFLFVFFFLFFFFLFFLGGFFCCFFFFFFFFFFFATAKP